MIGTWRGWGDVPTMALAIFLAYLFGYSFTLTPLLRGGVAGGAALGIAFAADTISITVMEIVDNGVMLVIPGAMDAGLADFLFWASLAFAIVLAWVAAFPVNRWLIARGRGCAVAQRPPVAQGKPHWRGALSRTLRRARFVSRSGGRVPLGRVLRPRRHPRSVRG